MDKFLTFLEKKVSEGTKSGFLQSMYERMQNGYSLTPNMISALEDAIEREETKNNNKKVKKIFKLSKWWMRKQGFHSMVLNAEVEVETLKAYKVTGHADIMHGTWCVRCGRELTQPASFTIGYGADCAKKVGIPYPKALNSMSSEDIEKYREELLGKLREQVFEGWIPKSQVVEVIDIQIDVV